MNKLSEKYIKQLQFIERKNKMYKKLKNILTQDELCATLNTTKQERTTKITKKNDKSRR